MAESSLGLESGKGASLFERRRRAAEQSALVKEAEESKSDAVNTTRSTFQDPINSKAGIVRKSSFRSSQNEKITPPKPSPKPKSVIEQIAPPPVEEVAPPTVKESPPSPPPPVVETKREETTGSTQIKREAKISETVAVSDKVSFTVTVEQTDVTDTLAEQTLQNTGSMLDQVAGKLSNLKARQNDDEDDVFAQVNPALHQRMDENGEIVYDDPGSVKDIRKKFGVRTNPEFAQPRGAPLLSGRNSRSSSIAQEPQSLNSSMTSESPKRLSQHRYSTEADKIFKEAIDQTQNSRPTSQSSLPPVDRLPPRPKPKPKPKPERKTSRPSSTSIPGYLQAQNTDILSQIENINKMTINYDSFDAAIADFYSNVSKLDSAVTPPVSG